MRYKIITKPGQCSYEEYDKKHFDKTGKLKDCGSESTIKVGHKYICINHLSAVMLADKDPEMEDHRPKIVEDKKVKSTITIAFREDFIKLAKGEDVNTKQLGFFKSQKSRPDISKMSKKEKKLRACEECDFKRCTGCIAGSNHQKTIIDAN